MLCILLLRFLTFPGAHRKIVDKGWKFCIFSSQVAMWIINGSLCRVGLIGNNCNVPTTLHRFPSLIKRHCPLFYWWQKGQLLNYQTAATEGKGSKNRGQEAQPSVCRERPWTNPAAVGLPERSILSLSLNPYVSISLFTTWQKMPKNGKYVNEY